MYTSTLSEGNVETIENLLTVSKVKALSATTLVELLIEKVKGIGMMLLVSTPALVLKNGFATIIFGSQFVVGKNFVGFPNVLKLAFGYFLVFFLDLVGMPLKLV